MSRLRGARRDITLHGPVSGRMRVGRAVEHTDRGHAAGEIGRIFDGEIEVDRVEQRCLLKLGQEHPGPAPAGARCHCLRDRSWRHSPGEMCAGHLHRSARPDQAVSGCSRTEPAGPPRVRTGTAGSSREIRMAMIAMTTRELDQREPTSSRDRVSPRRNSH